MEELDLGLELAYRVGKVSSLKNFFAFLLNEELFWTVEVFMIAYHLILNVLLALVVKLQL
jgi:hypothetical protein